MPIFDADADARPVSAAAPSATDTVRFFLAAMDARELEKAQDFLAADFQMTFPGGVVFSTLDHMVAWGKARYRRISKSYERFDEVAEGKKVIVYCFGTLAGEWPDGTPFSGIRFVDRFTMSGGKIVDQMVWNDLAEAFAAK